MQRCLVSRPLAFYFVLDSAKLKSWLLAAVCAAGISACGGGTAVAPTVPSSQTQLDNLNAKYDVSTNQSTSAAVAGTSTESIQSIFMAELATGAEEIIADIATYYQESVFLKNAIETNIATNANGNTTITVHHSAHGLHVGDKVTINNTGLDVNGIAATSFNKSSPISAITVDTYQVAVKGSAAKTGYANVDLSFDYLIADCIGKYNSLESAISEKIYKNKIENLEVFYTTSTVAQTMHGCSPQYYGDNVTTKYYKKITGAYELVSQNVDGGDYSIVYGAWKLPSEGLSSASDALTGSIGKIVNYENTRKLQNNGYTLVSYRIAPDTASSVFIIITLKNYTSNDFLMTTEANVYAKGTTGYQLIKRQVDYNNTLQNRVEISNFTAAPNIISFATLNGFSAAKAAEIKQKCNGLLFLSCARSYMPLVNLF